MCNQLSERERMQTIKVEELNMSGSVGDTNLKLLKLIRIPKPAKSKFQI